MRRRVRAGLNAGAPDTGLFEALARRARRRVVARHCPQILVLPALAGGPNLASCASQPRRVVSRPRTVRP
jgi:hypothetical protein